MTTTVSASRKADLFVSYTLRLGVLASAAVIIAGLLVFFISGESGYPGHEYPTQGAAILAGALAGKPFGIIMLGLLMLILTPVLRVGTSILIFIAERDWVYTIITAIVFVILLASLYFGK
ncbi:DUF1634 domain-containing protein [Azotosporobacter soli]|uniref:DUF1634 domain-containing protein n=1 Tax=Azotosporobacter soli TaxID=3055040 RepID=UPI0031FE9798